MSAHTALRAVLAVLLALVLLATVAHAEPEDGPTVEQVIAAAARDEGADPDLLLCLAWHESRLNPYAVSPTNDHGALQFHVYADGSSLMSLTPWAGASPFDVDAAAHAAAWLIVRGYGKHWAVWWRCA